MFVALALLTLVPLGLSLAATPRCSGGASVPYRRLGSRGVGPLPELAVDAALLYVPVGAVALLPHVGGISLRFRPIFILLTAVHYHYAGFVLPLVTGLAGRVFAEPDGTYASTHSGRFAAAATLVIANGSIAPAGVLRLHSRPFGAFEGINSYIRYCTHRRPRKPA